MYKLTALLLLIPPGAKKTLQTVLSAHLFDVCITTSIYRYFGHGTNRWSVRLKYAPTQTCVTGPATNVSIRNGNDIGLLSPIVTY